jgi:hypothetical protein
MCQCTNVRHLLRSVKKGCERIANGLDSPPASMPEELLKLLIDVNMNSEQAQRLINHPRVSNNPAFLREILDGLLSGRTSKFDLDMECIFSF